MILFALPASAARRFEDCIANCKLYDPDNLFSPEEQEELNQVIRKTSDDANVYVAVYVLNGSERDMTKTGCMNYADDRYDELFNPQSDVDTDGVLLVLNLDMSGSESGRYLYISTSGMGQLYYLEEEPYNPYCRCEQMMDHIVSYMPRGEEGDPAGAIRAFCADVTNFARSGAPYHA